MEKCLKWMRVMDADESWGGLLDSIFVRTSHPMKVSLEDLIAQAFA
jgi:hypothetical protein